MHKYICWLCDLVFEDERHNNFDIECPQCGSYLDIQIIEEK